MEEQPLGSKENIFENLNILIQKRKEPLLGEN